MQSSGSPTTDSDDGAAGAQHWAGSLRSLTHCCSATELPDIAGPCSEGLRPTRQPETQQMLQDIVVNVHGTYAPGAFLLLQVSVVDEQRVLCGNASHEHAAGKCIEAAVSYSLQAAGLAAADVAALRLYHLPGLGLDGPVCLHGRSVQPQVIPVFGIHDSSRNRCVVLCELLARTS